MTIKKFDVLVEEVTSRYQQGGILSGDLVKIRKDALTNDKLKDRPSNFMDMLKMAIETTLPVRVSAVKSERPETSNDLIGGVNNASTNFWCDVCIEYAPGLWRDPMTLPLEVLDLANDEHNLPEWPDDVKRKDNTTLKPEKVKSDSKQENIKQTQGDERNYGTKNVKMPLGVTKDGRDQTKIKESLEDICGDIISEINSNPFLPPNGKSDDQNSIGESLSNIYDNMLLESDQKKDKSKCCNATMKHSDKHNEDVCIKCGHICSKDTKDTKDD